MKILDTNDTINSVSQRHIQLSKIEKKDSELFYSSGGERARTVDLLLAKQALSQLSYTPEWA